MCETASSGAVGYYTALVTHDMAVALAKLGQNYDNSTFVNQAKFEQAQKALQRRLEEQMQKNLEKQIEKQLEGKGLSASARVAERQKRMSSESAKISKQASEEATKTYYVEQLLPVYVKGEEEKLFSFKEKAGQLTCAAGKKG